VPYASLPAGLRAFAADLGKRLALGPVKGGQASFPTDPSDRTNRSDQSGRSGGRALSILGCRGTPRYANLVRCGFDPAYAFGLP
jgi:hypothetical protein